MSNPHIQAGDNPDLTKVCLSCLILLAKFEIQARQSANFHPEDVTAFLFGSKEIVERKREISRKASDLFDNSPERIFG